MSNKELIADLQSNIVGDPFPLMRKAADAIEKLEAEVERLTLERDVNKRMRDQHFAEVESQKQMVIKLQSLLDANISLNERLQAQLAAAQPEVNAMLLEDVNSEIVKRYKVEKTKGGFWPYCVKAGDGAMELFVGSRKQADHVQQALQSACLDGAFMAITAAKQAQPECALTDKEQIAKNKRDLLQQMQAQPELAPLSEAQVTVLLDSYYASDFGPDELIRKVEQLHGIKQGGQHD